MSEVQALVSTTHSVSPIRKCNGFDLNRMSLLIAVAEKILNIPLYSFDIFFSAAGGIKLSKPTLDLPFLMALISSLFNIIVSNKLLILGEIGLEREVRAISRLEDRIKEASRI